MRSSVCGAAKGRAHDRGGGAGNSPDNCKLMEMGDAASEGWGMCRRTARTMAEWRRPPLHLLLLLLLASAKSAAAATTEQQQEMVLISCTMLGCDSRAGGQAGTREHP